MIRYRPHRASLSSSVKDEQIFSTLDDLRAFLLETCSKVLSVTPADLVIDTSGRPNPMVGYRNEHRILIRQLCVGYCDMEVSL